MDLRTFLSKVKENASHLPVNTTNVVSGFTYTEDQIITTVRSFFVDTLPNVTKLAKIGTTVIYNFTVKDKVIEYNYSTIEQCLKENYKYLKTNHKEILAHINSLINCYLVNATEGFDSFFKVDTKQKSKYYPILERFADIVNRQNEEDAFTFCLKYPFLNINQGLRKHLITGFRSNSGKSVLTTAIGNLYHESSMFKELRTSNNNFDIGNWNADVIDKFVTIIDDDTGGSKELDEDYLKNFMNPQMPLPLARTQKRESRVYGGSSVIAINDKPDSFYKTQINKRIIFMKLEEDISQMFNEVEQVYLHNIPKSDLLAYVHEHPLKNNEFYWFHRRENKYPLTDKEIADAEVEHELMRYLYSRGHAKNEELSKIFGKDFVRKILGPPRSLTINGSTFYGYKVDATKAIFGEQEDTGSITCQVFEKKTSRPTVNELSFEDFVSEVNRYSDTIESFDGDTKAIQDLKETAPHFMMVELKNQLSVKTDNVKRATGLVIDVDNSRFSLLSEVITELYKTGYKGIAYETASSNVGLNGLRYRVVIPNIKIATVDEYKLKAKILAKILKEDIDLPTLSHKMSFSGRNATIFGKVVRDAAAIVKRVAEAKKGERNNVLYWAFCLACDDDDTSLIKAIKKVCTLDDDEIERTLESAKNGRQ